MPELPEVENVCRGLSEIVPVGAQLVQFDFFRKDLRFKLPIKKLKSIEGARLKGVSRRAKYILFETDRGILFSHLGMTGQWRRVNVDEILGKHDHISIEFRSSGKIRGKKTNRIRIVYSDPRRFGFFDWAPANYNMHPRFRDIGVEPLSKDFNAQFLQNFFKGKEASVKSALLDQSGVAGLGNIYVCEALFKTGVRPDKKARLVRAEKMPILVKEIKKILEASILAGGSTIRDYRNPINGEGGYQDKHLVYGREGQLCSNCHTVIENVKLAGRSSFWCPTCQD